MDSKEKFEKLYKLLNGYNRNEHEHSILFDFYNKVGTGVFTLEFNKENNTCILIDNVEDMTDNKTGERLTLKEYYFNRDNRKLMSKLNSNSNIINCPNRVRFFRNKHFSCRHADYIATQDCNPLKFRCDACFDALVEIANDN